MSTADWRSREADARRSTRQRGIPADILERIRKARREGLSWSELKARFGYSQSTMWKALASTPDPHSVHTTHQTEIAAFSHPQPNEAVEATPYTGAIKGAA